MYWVKQPDGTFELLDGQQRTLSICNYYCGVLQDVKINGKQKNYYNLTPEQKRKFLHYILQIYICENGTEDEKNDWFQIINIAGEKLTSQEIRNAIYPGAWLTSAKQRFSKTGCVAYKLGSDYMTGSCIRQDYLETVLSWIAESKSDEDIRKYMAAHQNDTNADIEWQYFQNVINWVRTLFIKKRSEMKGVDWGLLYNRYKNVVVSATDIEERIRRLMEDDDVTNKKGVYHYVLSHDERKLNIRAFTPKMKREAYERQKGVCPHCHQHFELSEMEADHITPWSGGGKTTAENCQMLCRDCNRRKSNR